MRYTLGYSYENWNYVLEDLGIIERPNPNCKDCYDLYMDDVPKWQYTGLKEKKELYAFFAGMSYMKLRVSLYGEEAF